ncbi:MAG: DNA polymerase Y family protein, partial [Acidimicrobiales bacterium]
LAAALAARGRAPTGAADGSGAGGGNAAGDGAADGSGAVRVVPPGQSAAFLAPLPVTVLDQPELVGVLIRLGITTLEQLAALDPAAVLARFGWPGALARRLAAGLDERMPDLVRPGPELTASLELDPPLERVDQAAFAGKALAERFCARLAGEGLACLRVAVEAETEHGESLVRLWRAEGVLGPGPLTDRIRWQLDGWLAGPHAGRPTGGLSRLTLVPDQVVPARGRQLGFWGGETEGAERAARAAARLVGLLGPEGVLVPERRGGRSPREQLTLIPAAGVELGGRGPLPPPDRPWPGAPPPPLPAITPAEPAPAELVDEAGRPVGVSGRGEISAAPAWLSLGGAAPLAVLAWAGPWPVEERWWDPAARGRYARLQALTADGLARLLVLRAGRWLVEGVYD